MGSELRSSTGNCIFRRRRREFTTSSLARVTGWLYKALGRVYADSFSPPRGERGCYRFYATLVLVSRNCFVGNRNVVVSELITGFFLPNVVL
jgi:hypothetical protein